MNSSKIIYLLAIVFCAMPFVDAPIALLTGIILAQTVLHPFLHLNKKITKIMLQASVVGLGFGMNAFQAAEAGKQGLVFTIFSILSTMLMGFFLGRRFKVERKTSYLISAGTSICGGSAIAAVSPIVKPNEEQISTALGIIFILNSLALLLFPWLGKLMHLSQHQFGVWAAIAIHDTSSVVGAAAKFGPEALQTATTIKLERALWIIPVAFLTIFLFKSDTKKIQFPYFVLLFVVAMLVNTFLPAFHSETQFIVDLAHIGLKVTLFLIGTGLTKDLVKSVGFKPFLQGTMLWLFISIVSLFVITHLSV